MEANAGEYLKKYLHLKRFPRISLHWKLLPVQYWEYEYGLLPVTSRLLNAQRWLSLTLRLNEATSVTWKAPSPLSYSLIRQANADQLQILYIYEKVRRSFQSNQRNWKVSTINNVITERNFASRPWWNIYSSLNLPNFGDLQVLAPRWKTR